MTHEPDMPGLQPDRRSLLLTPFRGELAIAASTTYTSDSTAWQRVPLDCSSPGGWSANAAVLGDKIFFSLFNEEDDRQICVGTVVGS